MKHFLIATFVLHSTFLFGQLQMLVHENFTDNQLGWHESNDDDQLFQVKDGYYEMNTPTGVGVAYIQPPIDAEKDFSFEAEFNQVEGDHASGFGFIWGYDEGASFNNFIITTNGYVSITSTDKSLSASYAWEKIDNIKPIGQFNHLKFVQQNGYIKFYVNGKEVKSTAKLPWYGKTVGFYCKSKVRLLVDEFVIHSDLGINLPINLTKGLIKENLGRSVNSEYDEVTPVIAADGKTIFFTRKRNPENIGGLKDEADIWYSTSDDGLQWGEAQNLGSPVNSTISNSLVAVTPDNAFLLTVGDDDIDVFERTTAGWKYTGPIGLKFENESRYFEATQSADGHVILFAARTKKNLFYNETRNERDIFISTRNADGTWNPFVNLGPSINTARNEMSPFLAADGKTLYFASEGHAGYGGSDIFVSSRLDDSWVNWSTPVNLGPEINTLGYDAFYTMPASGDIAYMCSSIKSHGRFDLIRIRVPEAVRPDPVVIVKGRVLHAKTKQPIGAQILFEQIVQGIEAGQTSSNAETGEYSIMLPFGLNYSLHAQADGFLAMNEHINFNDEGIVELQKDLYLTPIEVGVAIQLNNVFFEQGRPILKQESYEELDRLVEIMIDNPNLEIELGGHSDNIGNRSSLIVLSRERVSAVKNYLVENGVHAKRITGKGYGPDRPVVKNDSEEHRQMNRRVEFKIVKK